ncbi:MAG: hypothetical protein R3327_08100 [Nitrosopumilaceae archaeon]|nr:hypothetical protein [Nitrosopumilaceae archaeon]
MNPKIFVGAAVAVVAIVIAVIATSGPSIVNEFAQKDISPQEELPGNISPVQVQIDEIKILEISEKGATLELVTTVTNPNSRSIIFNLLKYQLFEDGERILAGQIGNRPEGMVEGSNYYTILGERSIVLKDKIELKNSGNAPEFWSALENGNPNWRVTGEAFFNLSSMTSGQENEVFFEQNLP